MRITPVTGQGIAGVAGGTPPPATRSFRMNTNATPGRVDESTDQDPSTPDTSEPNAAADEETQPLSPQFAALAKQRRALQVKEREFEQKVREFEAKSGTQPAGIDLAKLKADPLGVMLEAGVTYEQLTEAVLASQGNADVAALKAQIRALEEGVDKKLTDRDQSAKQQALAEMKREADVLVKQGDDFSLVREAKAVPQVMTLIEKTYDDTGEVLTVREAMQLVEDELLRDAERFAGLDKVKAKMAPPPPPAPTPPQSQRQMRTLTNRDTASVPMSAKARAIAAFNGTLRR